MPVDWKTLFAVIAFLGVQTGTLCILANGDLRTLRKEWEMGCISVPTFLKVLGYLGLLLFASLFSIVITLSATLGR